MLIALFTDIHANREALDACLAHAQRARPDRIVFLGDYVGYGAEPGYVVDLVQSYVTRGALALRGNHGSAARLNAAAREAIEWTRSQLDETQRRFLASLPLTQEEDDRLFVHANAVAPGGWGYVTDRLEAARSLTATCCHQVFCGHLHVPSLYRMAANGLLDEFTPTGGIAIPLASEHRWLAVLGAVGQPRDGNPEACYALLDEERDELIYVRVPYDATAAAQKILNAGLPPRLAARLLQGW